MCLVGSGKRGKEKWQRERDSKPTIPECVINENVMVY